MGGNSSTVAPGTAVLMVALVACLASDVNGQDGQPPPGYPAVLRDVRLAFPTQDGATIRPAEQYLQMFGLPRTSALHEGPSWTFYARIEPMIVDGTQRL